MNEWPPTKLRRDAGDTPFGACLRNHPALQSHFGFDAQNVDYIWHDFKRGYMMLLEEKRFNATSDYAQQDTHSIIDQALRFAFNSPDFFVTRKNPMRPTSIKYFGYHLVQFERNTPDDGRIRIDGASVTKDEFLSFLRFEWMPSIRLHDMRANIRDLQSQLDDI